jgi:hypothetical protein
MKKIAFLSTMLVFVCSIAFANSGYFTYKVSQGDTLAKIAKDNLKDAKYLAQLLKYNGISHPREIVPGKTVLKVPYSLSKERAARLTMSLGTVKIKRGEENVSATKGMILLQKDQIVTAAGAKAEIQLDEGSVVRVGPNTVFGMDKYTYNNGGARNTDLDLKRGSMSMRVTKLSGSSNFKVSTVTAVAGVRGTFFYINYDDKSGQAGIAVYSGKVVVGRETNGQLDTKTSVEVPAGFATTVGGDGKPSSKFQIPGKIEWAD